jgi:hypothetical protein
MGGVKQNIVTPPLSMMKHKFAADLETKEIGEVDEVLEHTSSEDK